MTATRTVVDAFREAVQNLLVPELKSIQVSVEALHNETSYLRTEMKLRDERMENLIRSGDEKNAQVIQALAENSILRSISANA